MRSSDLWVAQAPWLGQFVAAYDATSTAIWRLRGEQAATGVFIGTVRGWRMRRREGVFDQFAALLQFPHYFGENWNAFADCISDLDWLRVDGLVLVVLEAVEVLAEGDDDEFNLLLNVFTEASESWARHDESRAAKPFHVLLHATAEQEPRLRARLAALALDVPLVELPFG
jgi:barstar (barnase inhibitor)